MKVMHLSKNEAIDIAANWAHSIECKAHECEPLWSFIKEVKSSFDGLTWREDWKCFSRGA